jgi:hypothetical protein
LILDKRERLHSQSGSPNQKVAGNGKGRSIAMVMEFSVTLERPIELTERLCAKVGNYCKSVSSRAIIAIIPDAFALATYLQAQTKIT